MIRIILVALVGVLVTGCAQKVWSKPGATISEFNNHNNQCQMVAGSATPTVYVPPSPTYTHSGTVSTPSGTGYYSGTSTPSPNFSALGATIGAAWARRSRFVDCMVRYGYSLGYSEKEKPWWKAPGNVAKAVESPNNLTANLETLISTKACPNCDLQGADLQGADLNGANLYMAKLQRANLQKANLQKANLREANLREANLRGAYLQGADLGVADLQGADLRGADLKGAKLDSDDLAMAKAQGAIGL